MMPGEKKASSWVHQYIDVTQSKELYLRLLQSEKMEAMGLLAGNIAHELNNPLSGLRSMAQVLMSSFEEGSPQVQDLKEIEKAAARSQKIIKNLLEFSTGGSQEVVLISMDELVQRTLPMLKALVRLHKQELLLNAEDEKVQVEPHLIQQVIFNLVNNAFQAMRDSGVLTIQTFASEDEVFLSVQDTGAGIPAEIRDRIFEPFFTTKQEGIGTGLGLSLSRKIIERFGGKLELEKSDETGSKFRIRLPRIKS
jgi:two-component system NtrC family sensor kinase